MKKEEVKNESAYYVTFNYNVVPEHPIESIIVLGDFNEWSLEDGYVLKENKKGNFEGRFKIPAGRDYHFRYLVNEKDADKFEASPLHHHIDNSVLSLPSISSKKNEKKEAGKKVEKVAEKVKMVKSPSEKIVSKVATKKPEVKKATPTKKAEVKPTDITKKAPAKKAASSKSSVKDDLTLIEGIGPKIAELLVAAGIDTFATLSSSKKANLSAILEAAGSRYTMHDPGTWAQQAKLAASGKFDQLKKLQGELKGGK
jgi:predicted flap endonuclease-1-like 5' DNA nuclease